ncbi:insecticidal delta-endotoxin Cry8Ea1 family protein [Bacillus cereus]|uniref:insecticidal delta-endotoxin Cry8Ea1 family protein n=1 Tax=Bacillus cereus TaxID=1396 RepID=UPI004040ED00
MKFEKNFESIFQTNIRSSSQCIPHSDLFSLENFNINKKKMYLSSGPNSTKKMQESCEFNEPFGNTLRAYVTASAGLVAILAGVVNPVVAPVVVAGGVVNLFLPILWPEDSTEKDQKLMCEMGALVDKKLTDFVLEQATKQLEGLEGIISRYRAAVKIFQDNRIPRDVAAESVRAHFRSVDLAITAAIPLFRLTGYEVTLLPLYCKLANTHLLLLRDMAAFGSVYGFTSKILEFYYEELVKNIAIYTNHCVKTYDYGLELAKKQKAIINSTGNNPQYPWMFFPDPEAYEYDLNEYDYQGIENWNLYNAYRRTMTLLVLDWIALWPTFDFKLYPIHMGLKTALTREVYTNIVGYHTLGNAFYWPWETRPTLTREQIEEKFIRKPHLFTWLSDINVRKSTTNNILTGILLQTSHTLSPTFYTTSMGTTENTFSACNIVDFPIIKVDVKFNGREKINLIEFKSDKDKLNSCGYFIDRPSHPSAQCGTSCEPRLPYLFTSEVPNMDFHTIPSTAASIMKNIFPHQLSWMYVEKSAALNDPAIDAVGCAWTHPSVDKYNRLASNAITQIPAVMAQKLDKNAQVISGPGYTGGDLVKIGKMNFFTIKVTLPINVEQEYTIRIYCANSRMAHLLINDGSESVTVAIPENKNNNLKTYGSFRLIDVPSTFKLFTKKEQYTLHFFSEIEDIIIDKIEFIPQRVLVQK